MKKKKNKKHFNANVYIGILFRYYLTLQMVKFEFSVFSSFVNSLSEYITIISCKNENYSKFEVNDEIATVFFFFENSLVYLNSTV